MRIHITGNAGAGKTTLAKLLGEQLDLPAHHLDTVVWGPGWTKPSSDLKLQAISKLAANDSWIIEGVSEQVRKRADFVIVLATPTYKCLYRCVKRCFQVGFRSRPELPPNCPEIAILFRAIKIVLRFQRSIGHQLQTDAIHNDNYIHCEDPVSAVEQLQCILRTANTGR
ncbi:MAG: hypothetical protein GKR90_15620 [Pseudomonadales bacterium]|nr:hypothetical protein [Pseudomonadales bacterium]